MNWLAQLDKQVFYVINELGHWPPLDNVMLLMRQPFTWIPVYLFFFLFFYTNCRRYFVPIVLMSVFTFALTDFVSASLLKPLIGRLRPCHDGTLSFTINSLAGCGGPFSMPSSHAANHFGLSTFWFLIINHLLHRKWRWLWLWAFCVGYAQVYVGVHFPADILGGALLGVGIATGTFYYFRKWIAGIENGQAAMDN